MTINSTNFLKFALAILLLSSSVLIYYTVKQEKNQQKQNSELINLSTKLDSLIKNNFEKQSEKQNICLNVFVEGEKTQELEPVNIKYIEEILDIATNVTAIEAPIYEENEGRGCPTIVLIEAAPEAGMQSFYDYISKNIKYPIDARTRGIQGKVMVSFVIDKNGEIIDVKAKNDIGGGCKEEAERVIKNAPKWNPARQRGKTVKVRLTIPIEFRLAIELK